jgi:hypothetical protein
VSHGHIPHEMPCQNNNNYELSQLVDDIEFQFHQQIFQQQQQPLL